MKKRLRKAFRNLKAKGITAFFRALAKPHHSETRIETARITVSEHLKRIHGNKVAYGPFSGMQLPKVSSWGRLDAASKILGTYERHIMEKLREFSDPDGVLIDIGSADGYFAIGALRGGLFATCICFEKTEKGRAALTATAAENGVADRITLRAEATEEALIQEIQACKTGVVLCDIEGGEFELLTDRLLDHFAHMRILIELHDFLVEDGSAKRADLEQRAARVFDIEIARSASPDIHSYRELDRFDDDHRLLAFSEGRDAATEWMILRPKEERA